MSDLSTIGNAAIDAAVDAERKRCVAILQAARLGEVDQDLRAIISLINSGRPARELIEEAKRVRAWAP